MTEWQLIETAPKDGSVFLALNHDTEVFPAKYYTDRKPAQIAYRTCQQRFPEKHTKMALADGSYGWVRDEDFAKENEGFDCHWSFWQAMYEFKPTHWMPLPEPPTEIQE